MRCIVNPRSEPTSFISVARGQHRWPRCDNAIVDRSLLKTTILLLVSDPIVRTVLEETLERAGYHPCSPPATWGKPSIASNTPSLTSS